MERTAENLVHVLNEDPLTQGQGSQEYDAWFRREVDGAVEEAADNAVSGVPHDQVQNRWREQRAELERRGADRMA